MRSLQVRTLHVNVISAATVRHTQTGRKQKCLTTRPFGVVVAIFLTPALQSHSPQHDIPSGYTRVNHTCTYIGHQ